LKGGRNNKQEEKIEVKDTGAVVDSYEPKKKERGKRQYA